MKRIGILGGTFDPIHKGHVQIALQAYNQLELDEIQLLPVLNNPFEKKIIASNEQRIEMLKIAIEDYPFMKINTYELTLDPNKKSYTYNTMLALKSDDIDIYFIIGMDQAEQFLRWKHAREMSELVHFCVFERKGYEANKNIKKYNMIPLEILATDASSSAIRKGDFTYLNSKVLDYMVKQQVYIPEIVAAYMSKKRFTHTMGVMELAMEMAESNGVDVQKAKTAALFHDIAKEMDDKKAKKLMKKYYPTHMDASKPVWHQWLSAYIAKTKFNIQDEEILQAIEHHTTADVNMSRLDMVIYCADKYDRNRGFDSSAMIALCDENIEEGFKAALVDFVDFSRKKGRSIDESFFEIYEKYVGD